MMPFTPIPTILLEDPALFGKPLGLYSYRGHPHPHPMPMDPSSSSLSHPTLFLSLPLHSDLHFPPLSDLCFPHSHAPCPSPSSVAKALCVKTVGAQALKLFQEYPIFSEVVSDQEAVAAIEKFVGMCQVLSRPSLLVQEPSGCPGYLVCQGIPKLQVCPQFCLPSLPRTPHGIQRSSKNRKARGTREA